MNDINKRRSAAVKNASNKGGGGSMGQNIGEFGTS